mmetsp:Transcript_21809/g.16161  ORF Transcript_21809/g.16161 Transcript_21809/m.16161 type:complete len:92 (+) Transcript_21809:577-852(+)
MLFRLRQEREEETGVIEYINGELEKIMKDQGVVSYSIQEERKEIIELEKVGLNQQTKEQIKQVSPKDQQAKAPLLMNYDGFEEEEKKSAEK